MDDAIFAGDNSPEADVARAILKYLAAIREKLRTEAPAKRWLNYDEAADYTGLGKGTLQNLVYREEITFTKAGARVLFDVRDLDAWMEERKVSKTQPRSF